MKLALLNTSIITADGEYSLRTISLKEAQEKVQAATEIISAIGHQSTAEIMTELLETQVPVNRILFKQEVGQEALVFKMNGRPQEGKILTREEIEEMGFTFQLMVRKA